MYDKYAKLRDAKKLTDYKVAKDTGIAKSTISEWKHKKGNPKADKIHKLAKYFGVSMDYFYDDNGDDEVA